MERTTLTVKYKPIMPPKTLRMGRSQMIRPATASAKTWIIMLMIRPTIPFFCLKAKGNNFLRVSILITSLCNFIKKSLKNDIENHGNENMKMNAMFGMPVIDDGIVLDEEGDK